MKEMTLAEAGRSLVRYAPFLSTALAIVLVAVVLPMRRDEGPQEVRAGAPTAAAPTGAGGAARPAAGGPTTTTAPAASGATASAPAAGGGTPSGAGGATTAGGTAGGGATSAGDPTGGAAASGGTTEAGGDAAAPEPSGQQSIPVTQEQADDPNCDTATGRVKVPYVYAVPCVPPFTGDNGGATAPQGVTGEEIVVAWYRGQADPALQAILTAAGADDSAEQVKATMLAYVDLFQKHYQTYGRTVKIVEVQASGEDDDDRAAKADAIRVAREIKAFASLGSPTASLLVYVEELMANGVICICTTQLPQTLYDKWGYVFSATLLMSYHQGVFTVNDSTEKQLAGRKAKWSGDPVMQQKDRAFGLICYDDAAGSYTAGCDFYEGDLKERGINHVVTVRFVFDLAQAQEQSRTMIAKLKESGATTLLLALDPIYPIFMTQEATRQQYFPEWQIVGGYLTDTTFFGRTYAQEQWEHAFGQSPLSARAPQEFGAAYRLHIWHHGRPPEADDSYGVIFPLPMELFMGIHMAGPALNKESFRDGLFRYPPTGGAHSGGVIGPGISYGSHGIWPAEWLDTNAADDYTLVWWDRAARCRDEIGNDGLGCLRYVDGGKRYFPGGFPNEEMRAFDANGTVIVYDQVPPSDQPPEYEHQPH